MTINLKKLLGDGGAGFDQSHGSNRLYDVLKAVVNKMNQLEVGKLNNVLVDGGVVKAPTNASTQLTGAGVTEWRVDVEALTAIVNSVNGQVAIAADEVIHDTTELVEDGESCYAYALLSENAGTIALEYVKGAAAVTGLQVAPTDAEVLAGVTGTNWVKLALCLINRTGDTTVTQSQDLSVRGMLVNPEYFATSEAVVVE